MTATPGAILSSAPQCTFYSNHLLHPPIRGEDDDFRDFPYMYSAPPCVYKRRRRTPSQGDLSLIAHATDTTHTILNTHTLSGARYWHSPQSSSPLAETWELPTLSHLACTPLLQALRCKIIQCTRTPLLDVRPCGRNQDKPLYYCVTSCINHLGLLTRSIDY